MDLIKGAPLLPPVIEQAGRLEQLIGSGWDMWI